jgi:hypothetical protein
MKRTAIRVEPISSYLERRCKDPNHPVIVAGEAVHARPARKPDQGI